MKIILSILFVVSQLFMAKSVFANSVLINEFMAHPTSGNNEWVEFYNPDHTDLINYWLDDDTSFTSDSGSSSKKSLSSINTTNITYPYLEFSSFLNNGGDYVVLFSSDGILIDQYQYTSDPGSDVTIGRSPDCGSWVTLFSPSKGGSNGGALLSPSPVSSTPSPAADTSTSLLNISNIPSQINSDEIFKVSVNLSEPNNANTKFYLKGAFKKADGSNYFGLTKVFDNWIKNSSKYSDQYPVTTDSSGNWSGNLEVKPDPDDSGYSGTGEYIFKVGKYNSTDATPSVSWSNEVIININSVAGSVEDENSTSANSLLTTSSNPPSTKASKTTSSKSKISDSLDSQVASIAGVSHSATPTSEEIKVAEQKQSSILNIWIILGIIFILTGIGSMGYLYYRHKKI